MSEELIQRVQQIVEEVGEGVDDVETDAELIEAKDTSSALTTQDSSWFGFLVSCSVNLFLPFINGIMLGFGEILAHEIGFRYNWSGARVVPQRRYLSVGQRSNQLTQSSIL